MWPTPEAVSPRPPPLSPPPTPLLERLPAYAELHCRSNFSFLTGASHPEELVARAAQLGYSAIAITDECSVAGVVRAHEEAKRQNEAGSPIKLLIGSVFELQGEGATPPCRLVLIARHREGYGDLCELITLARLRCAKGQYRLTVRDLDSGAAHLRGVPGCHALLIPRREDPPEVLFAQARWLQASFAERAAIAVELLLYADDSLLVERLDALAAHTGLPLVAAGDVLMHLRSSKPVQDTLTAVRLKTPLADCGFALARNAEQHLRSRLRLAQLYRPAWLQASSAHRRELRVQLERAALRVPGRAGARRPDADRPPARADRDRRARALPRRARPPRCWRRSRRKWG